MALNIWFNEIQWRVNIRQHVGFVVKEKHKDIEVKSVG